VTQHDRLYQFGLQVFARGRRDEQRDNYWKPTAVRHLIPSGRIVPVSARFFTAAAAYLEAERPAGIATDRLFVSLKGRRRGEPLSAYGVDEILSGATRRAGLTHASCHELRHTCLTRLREAGMALEAVQAQAGHASIESTRIYLHLANDWLTDEYTRAVVSIEAQEATR